MTTQPSRKLQQEAEDFLHDRGLAGPATPVPPVPAPFATRSPTPAAGGFPRRGMASDSGRMPGPAAAAHVEQPGHRHRGAEHHSAH